MTNVEGHATYVHIVGWQGRKTDNECDTIIVVNNPHHLSHHQLSRAVATSWFYLDNGAEISRVPVCLKPPGNEWGTPIAPTERSSPLPVSEKRDQSLQVFVYTWQGFSDKFDVFDVTLGGVKTKSGIF